MPRQVDRSALRCSGHRVGRSARGGCAGAAGAAFSCSPANAQRTENKGHSCCRINDHAGGAGNNRQGMQCNTHSATPAFLSTPLPPRTLIPPHPCHPAPAGSFRLRWAPAAWRPTSWPTSSIRARWSAATSTRSGAGASPDERLAGDGVCARRAVAACGRAQDKLRRVRRAGRRWQQGRCRAVVHRLPPHRPGAQLSLCSASGASTPRVGRARTPFCGVCFVESTQDRLCLHAGEGQGRDTLSAAFAVWSQRRTDYACTLAEGKGGKPLLGRFQVWNQRSTGYACMSVHANSVMEGISLYYTRDQSALQQGLVCPTLWDQSALHYGISLPSPTQGISLPYTRDPAGQPALHVAAAHRSSRRCCMHCTPQPRPSLQTHPCAGEGRRAQR
eukprot:366204-Chlamydomonas_euryale.AAC.1